MWDLFIAGGPLMYPLLIGSILVFTFSCERTIHFIRASRGCSAAPDIHASIENGQLEEALQRARQSPGPVAAVLRTGLLHAGKKRDELEEEVVLTGNLEIKRLNRNLHLIELISRTAPLVGLLGTVLGMVDAFRNVAGSGGQADPAILAGGIWEALLTTAAGLSVALPAMILHHFLEEKANSLTFSMKHYANEAIKHLGT
ncbi:MULTISPECIES: MotA/TolQ/ExbB proton channel family protein [Prosthecochloris]|uniref:MotA/TolQ/ExbB proton channel family protein n=1 Tax=Prosthecochloris vibrioformis TaxID=1098 RepID=A0A5C4S4H0_PROVB|nr:MULTISPECIES: MotA/TolQ/ExbB proton channel family protein [Prosthecochloris]ANT65514.1 Biopolymer transport protein ExbB [Prosthecochloris sp. CIB 2401]TNJ38102.1 MotA/TolQ/ExbB proton channel family protein [Prosthecochloris vibrioformis]